MRFTAVREIRNHPGEVWKALERDEEIVITSNGKPIGLLTKIDESTFEDTIVQLRRVRAALAVARLQEAAAKSGASRMGAREVNEVIRKARARHRRA